MVADAEREFIEAMADSENLIAIHRELNQGPGRRTREMSLNRAIVVLSVAAWQAYVQDLTAEALRAFDVPAGQHGRAVFLAVRADVKNAAHNFSTPNADNTRNLLLRLGFDPWSAWTWQEGPQHVSANRARERMDQWLRVRHAIAHGHDELPDVPVLPALPSGHRTLRRDTAEACMNFFTRVVHVTTACAASEFE